MIGQEMERFREHEKEFKMKQFSKKALASNHERQINFIETRRGAFESDSGSFGSDYGSGEEEYESEEEVEVPVQKEEIGEESDDNGETGNAD